MYACVWVNTLWKRLYRVSEWIHAQPCKHIRIHTYISTYKSRFIFVFIFIFYCALPPPSLFYTSKVHSYISLRDKYTHMYVCMDVYVDIYVFFYLTPNTNSPSLVLRLALQHHNPAPHSHSLGFLWLYEHTHIFYDIS